MSSPIEQLTPPLVVTQEAYTAHSGHGSVGPVIAVLAVITILGIIAGMIGRICSGRPIMGHGQYDFESWVERKCSSCLDGRINRSPPRQQEAMASEEPTPEAEPVEIIPQHVKQEEEAHRHTHGHGNRNGNGNGES